jgi:predicted GIY-YIG superfamily endonuclease
MHDIVALDEVMWYNGGNKIVVPQRCWKHPVARTNLTRRLIMDTISSCPKDGNTPTTYSIYNFVDPRTEKSVYVGFTKNTEARFKKHLSPKGILYPLAQELKREGLALASHILETTQDLREARKLEKKWIQTKKPLLNWVHNQAGIAQQRREKEFIEDLNRLCVTKGWTQQEAILYMQHFERSQGDSYTYKVIETAAQITREFLGLDGSFTQSELLRIALKSHKGIEVEE